MPRTHQERNYREIPILACCAGDDDAPVAQAAPVVQAQESLPLLPRYRKVVQNQIVAIECAEFDCGAALVAFEREYRDCSVVPIGPFNMDGNTLRYYFLVTGAQ